MTRRHSLTALAIAVPLAFLASGTAFEPPTGADPLDDGDAASLLAIATAADYDPASIRVSWDGRLYPEEIGAPTYTGMKKAFDVAVRDGRVVGLLLRRIPLKVMAAVAKLPALEELHLISCGIKRIEGLDALQKLAILDLNGNEIKDIEGLGSLSSLEALYLGGNRIKRIDGLGSLADLRVLVLYGNDIKVIEGLAGLGKLEVLHLSSNRIKKLGGLDGLSSLRELHLNSNAILDIEGLGGLAGLEVLDLSDNKLNGFIDDLVDLLAKIDGLDDVRVQSNPSYKSEEKALAKLEQQERLTLNHDGYRTTCEDDMDDVPAGRSLDWYMKKADGLAAEGRICNACAYYYKAGYYHGAGNGGTSDEAVDATIAAAFCSIEVWDAPQPAIKDLGMVLDVAKGERLGLAMIAKAEAMKRCGRLLQAARSYDEYLEAFPDGPYADLARAVRKDLYRFFMTNDIHEAGYHKVKQSGGLVFFELKTGALGDKYL